MNNYSPLPLEVTIKESPIHGLGLYATQHIEARYTIGTSHIKDDRFPQGWIRTPLGGFYNHSDKPNCKLVETGDLLRLTTIRPIVRGEELTTIYTLYTISPDSSAG